MSPSALVITIDGLGWLLFDALDNKGEIEGVKIPNDPKDLWRQQFVDDTNSFVHNESTFVLLFWKCLNPFCVASGSIIKHSKMRVWVSKRAPLELEVEVGCRQILTGELFRHLNMYMGFGVSFRDGWRWVLVDRVKMKFDK